MRRCDPSTDIQRCPVLGSERDDAWGAEPAAPGPNAREVKGGAAASFFLFSRENRENTAPLGVL